jgi:hypothetical protein
MMDLKWLKTYWKAGYDGNAYVRFGGGFLEKRRGNTGSSLDCYPTKRLLRSHMLIHLSKTQVLELAGFEGLKQL